MALGRAESDRGTLVQAAAFEAAPLVIVVGRYNFRKRTLLLERLCVDILQSGVPVCRFEAFAHEASRFLDEKLDLMLGPRAAELRAQRTLAATAARRFLKALILLFYPSRWRYVADVVLGRRQDVSRELRAFIRSRSGNRIYLLSNSAGCIAACGVEDEAAVEAQIGIGYPFRKPDKGEEPYRTAALAGLRKPFVIIQGADDCYGSTDDSRRYPLSPMVQLVSVEGGHDYEGLAEATYERILALVAAIIGFDAVHDAPADVGQELKEAKGR